LFLSTQAFACGGSKKTDMDMGKTDQNKSSMSKQGSSSSSDRDISGNQSGRDSNESTGKYDTTSPWNIFPMP
jgi:hypothetical protein